MKNNLNNKEKQPETKQRIVSYNKNKFYYKSKNENNSSIINNNNNNNDNLNNNNNNNNNNSNINNNSKKNITQTLKEKTKENLRFLNKIPKFDHIKSDINYNVEIKAQNNVNNNNVNNKINNVKNITKFIKIDENEINKDLKYPHRNYRYNNNNVNNNNVINNNFNTNNKNRKNEKNPLNNYNKKKFEKNENLSKNNNNYNINNKNSNKNNNNNKFQNYPINNNNKNTNNNNINNNNINYNKFNNYNHLPSQEEISSNNNNHKNNPAKNVKILNNINMYSNIPNFLISQNNTNNINDTNVSNPNAKVKQTTICDSIDEIEDLTMNYNEESVLKYPGYDKNQIIHIDNPSLINETKVEQNLLLQEIDTKINNENKDELEKQAILDELNNENYDLQFTINTNRPYTPPITELVPVKIENNNTNVKNNNLISEKDKNEKNMLLNSLKMNNNVLKDYENLVYDENVGYFFDTKKKIYYDLKQKN